MKKIVNILLALFVCLFSSCGYDEPSSSHATGEIKIVASQSDYNKFEVPTKAGEETNIYTAFFLLFDGEGKRVSLKDLTITNNEISPVLVLSANGSNTATAYFLVNVSKAYAEEIKTLSDLAVNPIPLSFSEEEGTVGIPLLTDDLKEIKDAKCIPMVGSDDIDFTQDAGRTIHVTLERLFAKIEVNLTVDIDGGVSSNFNVTEFKIKNIPNNVAVNCVNNLTKWAKDAENEISYPITENDATSFTFYAPEHLIGTLSKQGIDNTKQSNKPKLIEGADWQPMYISVKGNLFDGRATTYNDITYNIYLGKNSTNNFDIERNLHYVNNINITGVNTTDNRISFGGDKDTFTNLLEPTTDENGVVKYESANCYVISSPGKYVLPAFKGAHKDLTWNWNSTDANLASGKPEIVWNTGSSNSIADVNKITLLYKDITSNRIYFEIPEAVKPGNAVLAIRNASEPYNILWSWHLWFCPDSDDPRLESNLDKYVDDSEEENFNGKWVMNRALGATVKFKIKDLFDSSLWETIIGLISSLDNYAVLWNDGLYYQYGRKDPFMLQVDSDDDGTLDSFNEVNFKTQTTALTYEESIKNPNYYGTNWTGEGAGWSDANGKNVNDPCPAGYRVPSSNIWRAKNLDESQLSTTNNMYTYLISSNTSNPPSSYILFPYSSYINSDGRKREYDPEYDTNKTGKKDFTVSSLSISLYIRYDLKKTVNQNFYAGNDEKVLKSFYKDNHVISDDAEFFVYYSSRFLGKGWYDGRDVNDVNADGFDLSSIYNLKIFGFNVGNSIKPYADALLSVMKANSASSYDYGAKTFQEASLSKANGFHVRCVRETPVQTENN